MPKSTPCKGCGQPIIWAKSTGGKNQPFDAEPEKRGVILGNVRKGGPPIMAMKDAYMPHHATCPAVEMFR